METACDRSTHLRTACGFFCLYPIVRNVGIVPVFRNIERAGRCDQIAILLGHAVGFRFKIDGDLLAEVDLLRFVLQREGPERQRITTSNARRQFGRPCRKIRFPAGSVRHPLSASTSR